MPKILPEMRELDVVFKRTDIHPPPGPAKEATMWKFLGWFIGAVSSDELPYAIDRGIQEGDLEEFGPDEAII